MPLKPLTVQPNLQALLIAFNNILNQVHAQPIQLSGRRFARKEQSDAQTKADWEKTFAKGFSADALAALWLPPPEEA